MATATKKARTGKGKDGGGKKPVWVDEEAHVVLKEWAALTRSSMVDAASALVLESLAGITPVKTAVLAEEDDGDADESTWIGAEEVAAVAAAPEVAPVIEATPPSEVSPEPAAASNAPAPPEPPSAAATAEPPSPPPPPRRKPRNTEAPTDGVKQHVGGVWLV